MKTALPVGFVMVDVARLYRARFDQDFSAMSVGLTPGEARALHRIALDPGQRQSVLAVRMSVEPMTVVGYLDRLEGLGLVAREPDPSDRRAKIVTLTPAAQPYLQRIAEAAARTREHALAGLDAEEQAQLRDLLERVRANLAQPCGDRETAPCA